MEASYIHGLSLRVLQVHMLQCPELQRPLKPSLGSINPLELHSGMHS